MNLGQRLGGYTDKIIDVPSTHILAALAVERTLARNTSIETARKRRDTCSENEQNRPDDSLAGERGGSIAKAEGSIKEDFTAPANSEKE